MSVHNKIENINAMAEAMKQIKSIEIPRVEIPVAEELSGSGVYDKKFQEVVFKDPTVDTIDIDGADEWWSTWCEIRDIINNAFEANVGESGRSATLGPWDLCGDMRIKTNHISFQVKVWNGSTVHFIAEYTPGEEFVDTGGMLYEGEAADINEIELGRAVAGAEQEILAHTTESAAETLDYWQTELAPNAYSSSQSRWADIRNVGRQTVNDRVRSAKDALDK